MIGKTVSHYLIVDKLGCGGMSVVYKALDTRLGRFVALKFLLEAFCKRREAVEQFQQEARTASALNHPGICTIHDIDQYRDRPFIVMEYLEGKTLRDKMRKRRLTIDEAIAYGLHIVNALSQAHRAGIIHRDISPANLFVTVDGRVKLLDFGIAQMVSMERQAGTSAKNIKTKCQILTGTVHYMSPEQALGLDVDARSDIFSVGVVLYEMLTGRRPFRGDDIPAIINEIRGRAPESLSLIAPSVPATLQKVVNRCLEKCPHQRYPTAAELQEDLQSAAMGLSPDRKNPESVSTTSTFTELECCVSSAKTIPAWPETTTQIWLDSRTRH